MAKYKKRKDGRYQVKIYYGYDEETGKRLSNTIYANSIRELEEKKVEAKDAVNKGIYVSEKNITVKEWSMKWFETSRDSSGIKTKEMYHRLVYTHIIPAIGNIRLRDLKKTDIQMMINERKEHPRTCQQLKMCLNQILEAAIDESLLYKNVCRNINLPTYMRKEKRALTEIEKEAIQNTNFTDKEKAFIYVIQYCGIRRGEALALSKNNIDFNNDIVKIRNVITFDGNNAIFKEIPKSEAGTRDIPMPSILSSYLKEYIAKLESEYLFEMDIRDGFMTKSSYRKFWNRILLKLNLPSDVAVGNLTAHVFRHNYATTLFYAGIDIKEAQYLLGHSDVKLTLNVYTHLDRKNKDTISKLDNFFK